MVKSKSLEKTIKKSVLSKVTEYFAKSQYHAYLVGGYVRDLTLGRKPFDIDIVVEGNAVSAAKELNSKLKGKLVAHKEFGTASIIAHNERIDLASARTEKYEAPAELPHVYPSTIIEDLNRRDFTINAIAMSISRENFGEIFDPFEGMKDIKEGIIRVLHKNSFIDDPTRIFRALRYKNRFGFRLEPETKNLVSEAIAQDLITKLSGQRVLNELRLIFAEPTYLATIDDLSKLKIFKMKNKELEILQYLDEHKLYYYLAKLDTGKMPLTNDEKILMRDFAKLEKIIEQLAKATNNSSIYSVLSPINEDVIANIPSVQPELEEEIKVYRKIKRTTPLISGKDLKKIGFKPEKKYQTVLRKIFDLQIDNKIKNKKQALNLIKAR